MLIIDPVLVASMSCAHVPDAFPAVRDLADREVFGSTGCPITVGYG